MNEINDTNEKRPSVYARIVQYGYVISLIVCCSACFWYTDRKEKEAASLYALRPDATNNKPFGMAMDMAN